MKFVLALAITILSSTMASAACTRSEAIQAVAGAERIAMPIFLKYTLPGNMPWGGPAYLYALARQPEIASCLSNEGFGEVMAFTYAHAVGTNDLVNEIVRVSSK